MGQTSRKRSAHTFADPFWGLVAIARHLLRPDGCAWDRAQTVESLLPYLLEETWEVFDSIRTRQRGQLKHELGDTLYTVLFMALLAERNGWFSLRALLISTRRKMVRRHPHVFGRRRATTPAAAYRSWQSVKRQEGNQPSRSKALRPLLLESWELLHRYPQARTRFPELLRQLRRTVRGPTGRSKPASAMPARRRARG